MEPILTEVKWPDEESGPWSVRLVWELISGRLECASLTINRLPGTGSAPLRATDLRGLALRELTERSRPQLLIQREQLIAATDEERRGLLRTWFRLSDKPSGKPISEEDFAGLVPFDDSAAEQHRAIEARLKELEAAQPSKSRPGRPRMRGLDHYAKVAEIYAAAYLNGDDPTKAVAERFHVSRSHAGKWVATCRSEKYGLLGKTNKRKAGGLLPEESE
jgi:hypothetical protein